MSDIKKPIGLIAKEISFTEFSIIYKVVLANGEELKQPTVISHCPDNIKDKELILKPTILSKENMTVVFTPSNMTPHYFQDLLLKTLRNLDEHIVDLNNYYLQEDIVGYVFI